MANGVASQDRFYCTRIDQGGRSGAGGGGGDEDGAPMESGTGS